jgi:hypothetical protein
MPFIKGQPSANPAGRPRKDSKTYSLSTLISEESVEEQEFISNSSQHFSDQSSELEQKTQ